MRQRLNVTEPPAQAKLAKGDCLAAACVFLLVLLTTFPVVIPFFVASYAKLGLRVSNRVAMLMLFSSTCCALERHTGCSPRRDGGWLARF
jgi:VIT1/CCC1 family predicted Fe2+/Mn2+ transporter